MLIENQKSKIENPILQHHARVSIDRRRVIRRRDFLKGISLAGLAAGTLSWTDLMSVHAEDLRRRGMACILLWMQGGPSQFETFSPKPDHANGGETKVINTAAPGIQIAENFPHVAGVMNDVSLIRSMTTKEGNHQRASFLLHTGYVPSASIKHPTLGSLVSQQLGDPQCELPAFVRIGNNFRNTGSGGILGVDYDPFQIANSLAKPANVQPTTDVERYQRRLGLLERLEGNYAASGAEREVNDHRKLYSKSSKMILSSQMEAFNLDSEPESMRAAYGQSQFGTGCLLARRLVEGGVTFVEVAAGGWDTHQDNFNNVKSRAAEVDQPFAQLVADLKQRGLLDTTLVIWMGEFGRTPKINPRGGRDHYPKVFNVALAGGGIRGGRAIGQTDPGGVEVTDRPVGVTDLFQTFCKSLKIDPTYENMSAIGRPIKLVDGGEPVNELFT